MNNHLPKPYKVSELSNGRYEFRVLKAFQAHYDDGKPTGYEEGTPAGERKVTERRFIPSDKSLPIEYRTFW